nr:sulfatase-like hydrolase/transferase [uncultured Roseateles sp.]
MNASSSPSAAPRRALRRWLPVLLALYALLFVITGTWFLRKYLGPVTFDQVLFHLQHGGLDYSDPRMLSRAWRYLGGTLVLSLLLLGALRRSGRWGRVAVWGLLGLGAAASVAATVKDPCLPGDGDYLAQHYVDPSVLTVKAPVVKAERPDILLVFIESLDEAYTRPRDAAQALLPRLSHWHEAHQTFGALRNLSGASWTVGGLFTALCGVPLQPVGLMSRQSFEYSQQFFDQGRCLTDLLAAQGWDISFYGGASLQFAGKGRFLASHQVRRQFGREQWQARGVPVPAEGWGLLDSALSEQAWADMNRPRRQDEPRMHILLTVNTHGPAGSEDPGCAPAPAAAEIEAPVMMSDALRCTDRMIEQLARRFTEQADGRPKVVWIMGDHLAPKQLLADSLTPAADGARTVFHVLARFDGKGRELPAPDAQRQFSHVDVLPTLAEAAGLSWAPQPHRLGLGVSLLAPGAPATLVERDGFETADGRLACHSPLFARLWGSDAVGD